jgi:hypothetical protein
VSGFESSAHLKVERRGVPDQPAPC